MLEPLIPETTWHGPLNSHYNNPLQNKGVIIFQTQCWVK